MHTDNRIETPLRMRPLGTES